MAEKKEPKYKRIPEEKRSPKLKRMLDIIEKGEEIPIIEKHGITYPAFGHKPHTPGNEGKDRWIDKDGYTHKRGDTKRHFEVRKAFQHYRYKCECGYTSKNNTRVGLAEKATKRHCKKHGCNIDNIQIIDILKEEP